MTSAPAQICKPQNSQLQNECTEFLHPKKKIAENSKLFLYSAFIKKKVPNPFNHDYNFTCYTKIWQTYLNP